jgi:hypothetical protein
VSLDYNISDKDQLRGRWIYNKQSSIVAAEVPAFNEGQPNNNYMYTLSEFHNFHADAAKRVSRFLQPQRKRASRDFAEIPGVGRVSGGHHR